MEVTLTAEHLQLARWSGACANGLQYPPGTPIDRIRNGHLQWFESAWPDDAKRIAAGLQPPVPVIAGRLQLSVFGDGSGDGSGYGDGSGDGDGAWSGYGYGDGDGSGYGSGN
jgi:hypothetical protein